MFQPKESVNFKMNVSSHSNKDDMIELHAWAELGHQNYFQEDCIIANTMDPTGI